MFKELIYISVLLMVQTVIGQDTVTVTTAMDRKNQARSGHLFSIRMSNEKNDCFSLYIGGGKVYKYEDSVLTDHAFSEFKAVNGSCPKEIDAKVTNEDDKKRTFEEASITFSANIDYKELKEGESKPNVEITIKTLHDVTLKEWSITEVHFNQKDKDDIDLNAEQLKAPIGHSFSCMNLELYKKPKNSETGYFESFNKIVLTDFQIQPFAGAPFSDSYDCATWFTIATFAGLLVLILFTSILGLGICYIMNIKTNDRFEDPKGKPLQLGNTDN